MIESLSLADIESLNLVPVAAITVSPGHFTDLGITFDHGRDDLDEYDIAAFTIPATGAFALMQYRHDPVGPLTLMVEGKATDPTAFVPIMQSIANQFHIPAKLFHWQVDGQQAHLAEPGNITRHPETV